jgi:hypothetical protein
MSEWSLLLLKKRPTRLALMLEEFNVDLGLSAVG